MFEEEKHIRPANGESIENRVNVLKQLAKPMRFVVVLYQGADFHNNICMVRYWTRAHGHLPVYKFQTNTRWIFSQLQELLGSHSGCADDWHRGKYITPILIPPTFSDVNLYRRCLRFGL